MSKNRHQIRERILQILYAYELTNDPIEKIKSDHLYKITNHDAVAYAEKMIDLYVEHRKELQDLIISVIDYWDVERIAQIDIIIIRMCLIEFFYFGDIPPKVSINEAIELAKDFSTSNSNKFVNGILDTLYTELKNEGKIIKSGSGLINISRKKPAK